MTKNDFGQKFIMQRLNGKFIIDLLTFLIAYRGFNTHGLTDR